MPSQTIYVWLRQDRIDAGLEPGVTSTDQAELVAARRRIAALETELAVTGRAIEPVKQAVSPGLTGGGPPHGPAEPLRPVGKVA